MNQSVIINSKNQINTEIERLNNSMDFIKNRISINPINTNKIEKEENEVKSVLSSHYDNSILLSPILNILIDLGYNEKYSKRLISYFHPNNIDEALDKINEKNGKIHHIYIETKYNLCYVCGNVKEKHISELDDLEDENKININFNNDSIDDSSYNSNNRNKKNKDNNITLNNSNLKDRIKENNSVNSSLTIQDSGIDIEEKFNCPICKNNLNENEKIILDKCKHFFCKKCIFNFLKIKILENKVQFIKCLDYGCAEKISNSLIIQIIGNNEKLLSKYNEYTFRLEIINNPNKKFCPYPNCDSYLTKNENPQELNSKCKNGHEYCFKCLDKPHENNICKGQTDDENIKEYGKKKFIKKCPNCGTYTEKNEGCNHMICLECNYQWCWLCNQQYDYNHYINGKCKGFQFFQPKNENDIKLVFEGKIKLKRNERQIDFDNIALFINEDLSRKTIVCYFLLYLFFGQTFHIICYSPRLIKTDSYSSKSKFFVCLFYYFSIFFFLICYFFLQFFMNIISFISCLIYFGYYHFFNGWDYYVTSITNCNVFRNINNLRFNVVSKIINFIYRLIFNIFFGVFFMDFPYLHLHLGSFYFFPLFIKYLYCFSTIIIQFTYFFFQIMINFLIIVIVTIHHKNFHSINQDLKFVNKQVFQLEFLKENN